MSTEAYIDSATAAIVQPMLDKRDARIAKLEAELDTLEGALAADHIRYQSALETKVVALTRRLAKLEAELAALRGAAQAVVVAERTDSLVGIYLEKAVDALAALLEVKDEH